MAEPAAPERPPDEAQAAVLDGPMPVKAISLSEAMVSRVRSCSQRFAEQERERRKALEDATAIVREAMETSSAVVSSASSVDGRMIFVVDGALSSESVEDLHGCLRHAGFRRTNYATPGNKEFKHSICEHPLQEVSNTALFRSVVRLAQICFPDLTPLLCHRVYTNSRLYGDVSFVHRDSASAGSVTALVYPNPEWASELGGETLFYDEHGTIMETCEPAPGRVVIFNGSIWHKGSPPGRLLLGPRYTTAFKLESESTAKKEKASKGEAAAIAPKKLEEEEEASAPVAAVGPV